MEEQRGFIEQPFRQFDAFNDDAARNDVQFGVLFRRQFASGENDDRNIGDRVIGPDAFKHFKAGHVGQAKIEHDAIARLLAKEPQRVCARVGGDDVNIVVPEQFPDT